MKRLFIAFSLPKEIVTQMAILQKKISSEFGRGIKWVSPENYHITVKFLGDTEPNTIPELKKIMQVCFQEEQCVEIGIKHLGVFPNLEAPRTIWLGISGNETFFCNVNQKLQENLELLGFPKEMRGYSPHITLGRVKQKPANFSHIFSQYQDSSLGKDTISLLTLYESKFVWKQNKKEVVYSPLFQVKAKE